MLFAALGFAIMGTMVKLAAAHFNTAELVFYRSAFGLVFIWLYIIKYKLTIKTSVIHTHFLRSITGFISLLFFFYAIGHLPLASAMTLNYTSALFLGLLTPIMLKESPKPIQIITLLTSFIGITLLLQPDIHHQDWLATLFGLCSGVGAAFAYIFVKQLGNFHEPEWLTVFYFTLISTIGAAIWMFFNDIHLPRWEDMPILIGLGLSATLAQLALTRAYRTGNTLIVACLGYTTPILASLIGVIVWHESLNALAWFAIGLIIASGLISTYSSYKPD